jgi:2-amino-4-hydroxy-6-hydroxymethyldihydropteridine diphosphokinase
LSGRFEEALIGLGGNLGDPVKSIQRALEMIGRSGDCRVEAVSSFWRTPPWGKLDQPDFINACAKISTRLSPRAFLELCLQTEKALKRVRKERWGPRSIDIDILFFGDRRIEQEGLVIPHPRIAERAFVLVPLAEIAPDFVLDGISIGERAKKTNLIGIIQVKNVGTAFRQP